MLRFTFQIALTGRLEIQVEFLNQSWAFEPTEMSSMVLYKMKKIAEDYLGESVNSAVVTVPDFFNLDQTQATKNAALLAALEVIQAIPESSAAIIAFEFCLAKKVIQLFPLFL